MAKEITSQEDLLKDLSKDKVLTEVNILFLDLSSSCTGYTIVGLDFTSKKATFKKAGALWFGDWENQDKYHYMFKAITDYFYILDKVDYCVAEAYMINPSKLGGALVSPELHGAIQMALSEVGLKYNTIPVQSWRAALGIKPIVEKGEEGKKTKDYKTPTKDYVNKLVTVPSHINSNITKNSRQTPSDLYDAMAIAMGFLKRIKIDNFDYSELKFQPDVGLE